MLTATEIVDAGREIYANRIRSVVEPDFVGQFIAIDIDSQDYEIDPNEIKAVDRLRARRSSALPCLLRIGQEATHRIGATSRAERA